MKVNVRDKIIVPKEKQPYIVQARDDRYIIATKKTRTHLWYFIIDLERNVRGPDNNVFCFGYEDKWQCEDRLRDLQKGIIEVSYRNSVELDVEVE